MKRTSLLLSFAVLAHLSVIDLTYFLLNHELAVNVLAVAGYNIVWLIIAALIGSRFYRESAG